MSGPFGVNILAQYVRNRDALLDWIERAKPASVVVMDGIPLALQIRQRSPDTLVINRLYNPNDAQWETVTTPMKWLEAHQPYSADQMVVQLYNEPAPGNVDTFLSFLEKTCELCPPKMRLVFPNFAVGNPNEKDILAGKYDRLLKLVCGTRHILALHEYFKDDPGFPFEDNPDGEAPYLCGRFSYWLFRAHDLGLPLPHIVITEHGRDVGGGRKDGWRDTGWSEQDYFQRLTEAQTLYYPGVPVALYCWGTGAGDDWLSFDIQNALTLQKLLIDWNTTHPIKEQPPMPDPYIPPPSTGTPGVLSKLPGAFVNLREQPYLDASDRGDLRKDEPLSYGFSDQAPGWVYITRTSDGVHGWVSLQGGKVEFAPDTPPPEPEPGMVTYTDAQVSAMREHLNSARGHLMEINSLLGLGVPSDSGAPF